MKQVSNLIGKMLITGLFTILTFVSVGASLASAHDHGERYGKSDEKVVSSSTGGSTIYVAIHDEDYKRHN